jgi:hypothetical protein
MKECLTFGDHGSGRAGIGYDEVIMGKPRKAPVNRRRVHAKHASAGLNHLAHDRLNQPFWAHAGGDLFLLIIELLRRSVPISG